MRSCDKTTKRKAKERKISSKVFKFKANLLNDTLSFPAAKNSVYNSNDLNQCLIQALTIPKASAESGLVCLQEKCGHQTRFQTERTFKGRVERITEKHIPDALITATTRFS